LAKAIPSGKAFEIFQPLLSNAVKNEVYIKKYAGVLHIYFVSGKLPRFGIAKSKENAHNPGMCIKR